MFCTGCGVPTANTVEGAICEFCQTPLPVIQAPLVDSGYPGDDIVNTLTTRFSINQLAIFGGCVLLFLCLIFPFVSFSFGRDTVWTLGFALVFRSFSYFLDLFVPLVAVGAISALTSLSIIKLANAKLIVLWLSAIGAYMSLSTLFYFNSYNSVGIGLILYFLLWLFVSAAAFLEYKNIHLIKI